MLVCSGLSKQLTAKRSRDSIAVALAQLAKSTLLCSTIERGAKRSFVEIFQRRGVETTYSSIRNPHKVLDAMQRSSANSDRITQTEDSKAVQLPDTPVTFDVLTALSESIEKTLVGARSLNSAAKISIEKLANAAKNAFAERSIL